MLLERERNILPNTSSALQLIHPLPTSSDSGESHSPHCWRRLTGTVNHQKALAELHEVPASPFLQLVEAQSSNCSSQFDMICNSSLSGKGKVELRGNFSHAI